jgi:hypothetical protein
LSRSGLDGLDLDRSYKRKMREKGRCYFTRRIALYMGPDRGGRRQFDVKIRTNFYHFSKNTGKKKKIF